MQEKIEIIWFYRPVGAPVGEQSANGLSLLLREGTEADLCATLDAALALTHPHRCICVLNYRQYLAHRVKVQEVIGQQLRDSGLTFILIEDDHPLSIRQQKTLPLKNSTAWTFNIIRRPFSFNELMGNIYSVAHSLFVLSQQFLLQHQLSLREGEASAINDIGIALTSQTSVDSMVRTVLEKALDLCSADAGFLLLRENHGANQREGVPDIRLLRSSGHRFFQKSRVCKSQNLKLRSESFDPAKNATVSFAMNYASGVVWESGWSHPVAHGKSTISLTPQALPNLQFEFDARNYDVRSYCLFPLKTPSGEVVGFILLVNKKIAKNVYIDTLDEVQKITRPFSAHDLNLLEALAAQVGVSLDHARLIQDLKRVFESFVQASVVAIESRDPSTKGHSERVAVLTVGLAEAVNVTSQGQYSSVSFNASQLYEIKYAALLHDFGKIGVRENILRKERKLFHHELMAIQERFHILEKRLHLKCLEEYLQSLMNRGIAPSRQDIERIQQDVQNISSKLHRYWENILEANEPSVVRSENFQKIMEIAAIQYLGQNNGVSELLLPDEVDKLTIKRGSLSNTERLEIESHVTHSFKFLVSIPWTQDLANIPDIVYAHHERMDGTGYPRQLVADEIPIQAKIMAIADVYDALVAVDRPYKLALPHERALSILEVEVNEGKLDSELFKIFVEAKVGELIKLPHSDEDSAA